MKKKQNQYYNNIDAVINKAIDKDIVVSDKDIRNKFLISKSHDLKSELDKLKDIEHLI